MEQAEECLALQGSLFQVKGPGKERDHTEQVPTVHTPATETNINFQKNTERVCIALTGAADYRSRCWESGGRWTAAGLC